MSLTFNGGTVSYLTPAEFFKRVDWRPVGQLVSDDNNPADYTSLVTTGTADNAKLVAILNAASGLLEAHCLRSKRYQAADLAGMPAGSNAAAYRDDILSGIALERCYRRRPALFKQFELVIKEAYAALKSLADGQEIFPFTETQQAGLPDVQRETPSQIENLNLATTQARRYFGTRGNQITCRRNYGGGLW